MCCENNDCIAKILEKILLLQKQDFESDQFTGCDKPFLGPVCNTCCYNTRPIMLYNCSTGNTWNFKFKKDEEMVNTDILRIESIDNNCCICRLLYLNDENNIISTNDFCTINLNCIGAIKCLPDIFVDLC